jgi:hypothetical protein
MLAAIWVIVNAVKILNNAFHMRRVQGCQKLVPGIIESLGGFCLLIGSFDLA